MPELRLTDYDRACLREWKISLRPDVRTPREAEERFVVPEWLRRTQWRYFGADQVAIYAYSRQVHDAANQLTPRQRVSDPTDNAERFQLRKEPGLTGEVGDVPELQTREIKVPVIVATILLVLLSAFLVLGVYLFNLS